MLAATPLPPLVSPGQIIDPRRGDGFGPFGGGGAQCSNLELSPPVNPEKGPFWRLTHKVPILWRRFRLNGDSLLGRTLLAALARDGCVFLMEAASGETSGAALTPDNGPEAAGTLTRGGGTSPVVHLEAPSRCVGATGEAAAQSGRR